MRNDTIVSLLSGNATETKNGEIDIGEIDSGVTQTKYGDIDIDVNKN